MSVLIVGSIALDSVKTPWDQKDEMLGGSATYFSLAASHFAPVRLVAVVGQDFPEEYCRVFESRGIDLQGLQVKEGETFRWSGRYHGSMNEAETLHTHLNVFEGFKPVIPDEYRTTEWIFLGNIDPSLQTQVLSQVNNSQLIALDTMNFWIQGSHDALLETLKKIDLLIINEGELRLLTGKSNIPRAAGIVQTLGPKSLVIKRGEYGAVLFHDNEWFYVPGYPEEKVVDPTGAGDSFAGGFMGALARENTLTPTSLKKAMVYGSVMASFNITSFGPWALTALTPAMIEERYQVFRKLVSV